MGALGELFPAELRRPSPSRKGSRDDWLPRVSSSLSSVFFTRSHDLDVLTILQELQGRVVSTSGNNTTIVAVENITMHPLYSKRVKRTVRHTCHDDKGEATVGDVVTLVPTRPLSKTKRFIVGEILQKAN